MLFKIMFILFFMFSMTNTIKGMVLESVPENSTMTFQQTFFTPFEDVTEVLDSEEEEEEEPDAKVAAKTKSEKEAFKIAVLAQNLGQIRKLLEKGINPDTPVGECGDTGLHFAVAYKNQDMIELFLSHHASPQTKTLFGKTPHAMACKDSTIKEFFLACVQKHQAPEA